MVEVALWFRLKTMDQWKALAEAQPEVVTGRRETFQFPKTLRA